MIEQTTEANYLNERCDFRDIFFTKRQLARPFPNAVRPSVRPSRSCIESKRVNNTFSNHLVNPPFWFFHTKHYGNIPTRTSGTKISIFDHYLALGSMTGGVSSVVYKFRPSSRFITPSVGLRL